MVWHDCACILETALPVRRPPCAKFPSPHGCRPGARASPRGRCAPRLARAAIRAGCSTPAACGSVPTVRTAPRTRDGTPLIRPFALQPSFRFIVSVTMRVCWLASLGYPFPSSPTAARRHGGVYELCNRGSSRTFTCAIRSDSRPQRWALTGPHGRAMSRRQGDAVRVPTFALIIRYSALFPCLNARTRARPRCCGSLTIGSRGRIADG